MEAGVAEASTDGRCYYFHQFMADLVVDIFDSVSVGPSGTAITHSLTHSPIHSITHSLTSAKYYTDFKSFLNTEF